MKNIRLIGLPLIFTCILYSACQKNETHRVEFRDGIRRVHNLEPESNEPSVRLEFVRKIGGLDVKNEKEMFHFPVKAALDAEGNIYVLDSQECFVSKFDSKGQYVLRFGRQGQGPGEFEYPQLIDIDGQGRLIVAGMSTVFHIFNLEGEFISRFRLGRYEGLFLRFMKSGHVVGLSMQPSGENTKDNKVLKIFNLEGDELFAFGEPHLLEKTMNSWRANFLGLALDPQDNIYAAFVHQNRIEKYSPKGELLMRIDRALPFEVRYRYKIETMDIGGQARQIEQSDFTAVSRGIGIDNRERIWVLSYVKEAPAEFDREIYRIQDFNQFEVFSPEGILLYRVPIPREMKQFDNFSMWGDRILFVDPFDQACVSVYRIIESTDNPNQFK